MSSRFAVVLVYLELMLDLYQYLFQGGNYDGILFASGLLQTVIYRFQRNHKTEIFNNSSHFFLCKGFVSKSFDVDFSQQLLRVVPDQKARGWKE